MLDNAEAHPSRSAKQGKLYNLAVPLEMDGPHFTAFHKTWCVTHYSNN